MIFTFFFFFSKKINFMGKPDTTIFRKAWEMATSHVGTKQEDGQWTPVSRQVSVQDLMDKAHDTSNI
jgi:hypothetical protein